MTNSTRSWVRAEHEARTGLAEHYRDLAATTESENTPVNEIITRRVLTLAEFEEKIQELARLLDPAPFSHPDHRQLEGMGPERQAYALAEARQFLLTTGVTVADGTVDPAREISDGEFKALVAIEAVEYLTRLSIQILTQNTGTPEKTARAITRVTKLLAQMADITTTRIVTAVKRPAVSDQIAAAARERVDTALLEISPPLTFPGLPDGWELLEQNRHWQQAFNTPAGYAVITALPIGQYEIEFRGDPVAETELSPTEAMLKLSQLVERHLEKKKAAADLATPPKGPWGM